MRWNKTTGLVVGLVCMVSMCAYIRFANQSVQTFGLATDAKVIVIDPGHGGFDPGKVGISGSYEKDINLKVALKLKEYLEQSGTKVIMTRISDEDLDGMEGKAHKSKDMQKRKEIINTSQANALISIHQNAFTQSSVRGAQVFYHQQSEKGKLLAECVDDSIKKNADNTNTRKIKSSEAYYVLRVTSMPAIIVECGFLTNTEEEKLLNSEAYQDKMAWAIYKGIVDYFQKLESITE